MATEILTTFQLKRGTAQRWIEVNPILKQGEPGFEYDTNKLKIGDGLTNWINLPYITQNINSIVAVDTFSELPKIGNLSIIYKVNSEKTLYQWNPLLSSYEKILGDSADSIKTIETVKDAKIKIVTKDQSVIIDDSVLVDLININTKQITTLIGEIQEDKNKSMRIIAAEEVSKIVAGAPEELNTLKELADFFKNNTTDLTEFINTIDQHSKEFEKIYDEKTGILAQAQQYTNQFIASADNISIQETIDENENKILSVKAISTDLLTQGDNELILSGGSAL